MADAATTASSIGTQVTRILGEATASAEELLAEADHRADRAGREELAELRESLIERIDALSTRRARLDELGGTTVVRLREAAADLTEIPPSLAEETRDLAGEAFLDSVFADVDDAQEGPPPHLAALMKAADAIAADLAKEARRKTRELDQAARRETDRIASKEPRRLARVYEPTVTRAEKLHHEAAALSQLLAGREEIVGGPTESKKGRNDGTGPDERRRSGPGNSWRRR